MKKFEYPIRVLLIKALIALSIMAIVLTFLLIMHLLNLVIALSIFFIWALWQFLVSLEAYKVITINGADIMILTFNWLRLFRRKVESYKLSDIDCVFFQVQGAVNSDAFFNIRFRDGRTKRIITLPKQELMHLKECLISMGIPIRVSKYAGEGTGWM